MPKAISAAAKMNHQNSVGSTSDKMIMIPAKMAIQPNMPPLPLRKKTAPLRIINSLYAESGKI